MIPKAGFIALLHITRKRETRPRVTDRLPPALPGLAEPTLASAHLTVQPDPVRRRETVGEAADAMGEGGARGAGGGLEARCREG